MKFRNLLFALVLVSLALAACQPAAAPPTTAPVEATPLPPADTPVPTATPLPPPTETPKPTSTPLPEGVLFRDDFNGELQPGWTWENENPDKWTFTDDGWLQIIGEYDALLGEETQTNLLWYPLPQGNFVITAHLQTKPFEDFQQAAIFIYEDPENYITINRGYCSPCAPKGNGFYMDYKISGEWGNYNIATSAEDVYLRLENKDNVLSGFYATAPDQWERLGRFGNYFQFEKVGIGVSNAHAEGDVIGLFDYFEISLPE